MFSPNISKSIYLWLHCKAVNIKSIINKLIMAKYKIALSYSNVKQWHIFDQLYILVYMPDVLLIDL